jgi:hypothetical protein
VLTGIQLSNIHKPETHLALILLWLIFGQLTNDVTTAKLTLPPARLTALIGKQTGLTHLSGGNDLSFGKNY